MMTEALANIHINKPKKPDKDSKGQQILKTNSALNMFQMRENNFQRAGSFVVGQKLRESKWFSHNEQNIFCAVIESGFIVEQKKNDEETRYGVAIWTPGYEKSKNPQHLTIYTISENKGKFKVLHCTLEEFWPTETKIRINNKSDKHETPLNEEVIRNQILAVEGSRKKWHNTEHFAYFCRYGPVETHLRMRKITDHLRWNTGAFFHKIRSLTAK